MAEILLSQQTAAEVNEQRQKQIQQQQAAERFALIRAQTAATVMAGLMQVEYGRSLEKEDELFADAVRKCRNDVRKRHGRGQPMNGQPQRRMVPTDVGRPAAIAVAAADQLLAMLSQSMGAGEDGDGSEGGQDANGIQSESATNQDAGSQETAAENATAQA